MEHEQFAAAFFEQPIRSVMEGAECNYVHTLLLVPVIMGLTALEQNIYDEQESNIEYQIVSFYLTLHVCAVKRY
jgi:hypothetical protein